MTKSKILRWVGTGKDFREIFLRQKRMSRLTCMFGSSGNETGPFVPAGMVQEDLALPPPAPIDEDMEEDDEDVIMGTAAAAGAPTSTSPPAVVAAAASSPKLLSLCCWLG